MARIRSIHPDVHADPRLARASSDAWRLYFGIANQADDFGVCADAPDRLQLQVFAARPDVSAAVLIDELVALGKLARYVEPATGKRYLHCVDWSDEQKISKPSWEKRHPSVDTLRSVESGGVRGTPGESGGHPEEGKGEEGKGELQTATTPADAGTSADAEGDPPAGAPPAPRRSRKPARPRTPKAPKAEPAPDDPAAFMPVLRPIWRTRYGADMRAGAATILRPLVTEHGVEKVAAHLAVYVATTLATYAPNVLKFSETFGACAPGGERETSKPAQSAIPQLAATASADDVTTRREAQALYETLRRLELPHDANRAGGMFKAAVDRGTLPRAVAVAVFRAVYGWDGIPPDDGGALRGALREGRAGDAVRSLEAIVREAASARSEAA